MRLTTFLRSLAAVGAIACAATSTSAATGYCSQPALHGDRLIFVSEGDLWIATLDPTVGNRVIAHRLTNGQGGESNPIISPDGTKVAFVGEYEGNPDVYVMPITGGVPQRLTYHPAPDVPLAWSRDGTRLVFRSPRSNPLGRDEAFWVAVAGGLAQPFGFGECSQIAFDPASGDGRYAFCRWSTEEWHWKRYRGGTAPDVWLGDATANSFTNLTESRANDMFPMWIGGSLWCASDRDGVMNLWSMKPDGSSPVQRTRFVNDAGKPTDPASYELRWPSADASGGGRIAFAQGGKLAIFHTEGDRVQRLDVELVSDRVGTRRRFVDALAFASEFSLSPSGDRLLLESRGELLVLPIGKPHKGTQVGARQITHESSSREWGAAWLSEKELLCVTDSGGEQQLATVLADGSSAPRLVTTDRTQWMMRPVASPDGRYVAFGDKDLRLWLLDVAARATSEVDRSEAGEIVEYAFSADGAWLAWSKPMPNGNNWISIRATAGGDAIHLSDGMTNDHEPQFDPRGKYLWFLSDRHLNPILGTLDFEHALVGMTEIFAVPLEASTPPPSMTLAAAAGFDLRGWAKPSEDGNEDDDDDENGDGADGEAAKGASPAKKSDDAAAKKDDEEEDAPIKIDAAGIRERIWRVPVEPGNHQSLIAAAGGVWFLTDPVRGIDDEAWPAPPLGEEIATLARFNVLEGEAKEIVDEISSFAASSGGKHVAWMKGGAFHVLADGGEKPEKVDLASVQVEVDPLKEWTQILEETWRLQRDFYWAPNMAGVNWNAMRERYRALLPLVGTRDELNDVLGQMLSELGTSHTYIMGGDDPDRAKPVGVGVLGVDFGQSGNAVTIASILPGRSGDSDLVSPLALPHLEVKPGSVILSIDGRAVTPAVDPYGLLQGRAGKAVAVEIADDAQGNNRRTIEVVARAEDHSLRYAQWVDANRRRVEELSGGALGYVHVPDMGADGLIEFSRTFYAQLTKKGMVLDIRNNGGGWISQLILARVAREPWAYQVPRSGRKESYPQKVLNGPFAILIDEHAGSDGDIFPESVRIHSIAPLIGTRTWGGVVGIRGDKPSIDNCTTTQPEFAWFDPSKPGVAGWSVENEGVAPDIEVVVTPADRAAGRDPQLAKAVEVLLESLRTAPRPEPTVPGYPDRSAITK